MLQAIRDKAQGWIAWVIVILISIPFALWGINEYLGGGGDPAVAEVDGVEIPERELDSAIQRYRQRLREQLGASYNPDFFPDSMVRRQVLDGMIRNLVIAKSAADLGLRAGNDMLRSNIRQVPAFQSGGRFDPGAYESALRLQGYTPAAFEQRMRDELATMLLENGVMDGALVTDREVQDFLSLRDQARNFSYVVVPAARFADLPEPDEAAVKAFYDENAGRFVRPERVRIAYLELSRDQLADSLEVGEEVLRDYYEARKTDFTAPEQRRIRHILVTPDGPGDEADAVALAQASDLLGRLRAGEEFAELAKSNSADPGSGAAGGDLGLVGRGVMVAPFEEAAFSLDPGVVSEPVKTQFGYHLIEVTEVVPAHVQGFEEARDRVARNWRQEEAERLFYDQAERLADLVYENPGSLDVAAEALGLEVRESEWLTSAGGSDGVLGSPKVLAAAFSEDVLVRGNNSDAIELDATHVLVLRSVEHEEAAPLPLDDVRDDILAALNQQDAAAAAGKVAGELRAAVEAGESLEDVAARHELTVVPAEGVRRDAGDDFPAALVTSIFTAGLPQEGRPVSREVALGGGDRAVFVLNGVVNADVPASGADEFEAARAELASRRAQRELSLFVAQARAEASVVLKEPVASE